MEGNKDKGEEWESSKIMDMLIINSAVGTECNI
jgi:hypothetical protein